MAKTALVVGGSRGIGRATVEQLQAREWRVIAPPRDELKADSPIIPLELFTLDRLDALVFCAGEWYSRPYGLQVIEHFWNQYDYVTGMWQLMLSFIGKLEARAGCVVAVASTRGLIGGIDTAPYSCAKAAQIALIQGFAREYQGRVRFNCVCPGLTDTDMGAQVIATGGAKPDAVPQPPEFVAAEIVRLIESDDNGKVMRVVDGIVSEARWTW